MAKDITINGASFMEVPSLLVPLTYDDGYAEYIESSEIFKFSGRNPELVSMYSETYTLADTSFEKGVSASTSAMNIRSSVTNKFMSDTIDVFDKDIIVIQRMLTDSIHNDSAPKKNLHIRSAQTHTGILSKRQATTGGDRTTRASYSRAVSLLRYYDSKGSDLVNYNTYGFYCTFTTPSVSSQTADKTIVRVNSPALNARGNATYESVDNMKLIEEVIWTWYVEVYLVDPFTSEYGYAIEDAQYMLDNGLYVPRIAFHSNTDYISDEEE